MFENSERSVIIIGHGCTGARDLLPALIDLGIPVLTSWQAIDLVDNYHPNYFGRTGIYGQRHSNKILYNADLVIAIGCRLSIWQVGYGVFAPAAKLVVCDIDRQELDRFPAAETHCCDAREFIVQLIEKFADWWSRIESPRGFANPTYSSWLARCMGYKQRFPLIESCHRSGEFIHSHEFVARLEPLLTDDEIIVTDMGAAMVAAHQVLRIKPGQRLMTSGGLGEMGVALPAAIGAAFASDKKRHITCLHCDGGMMLNLQELATIAHHNLPVRIIVFNNTGYGMIKGTQNVTLEGRHVGVGKKDLSFPDFVRVAWSFGLPAFRLEAFAFFEEWIEHGRKNMQPMLIDYRMDPEQPLYPKLNPIRNADGTISDAKFDEMSPLL